MDHLYSLGEHKNELEQRARTIVSELSSHLITERKTIAPVYYRKTDYKSGSVLPKKDDTFTVFGKDDRFGGEKDSHAWFYTEIDVPEAEEGYRYELFAATQINAWDATNPQFMLYVDGVLMQGMDCHHTCAPMTAGHHEVWLYAYTGTNVTKLLELHLSLQKVDTELERLYYDLWIPMKTAELLDMNTEEYALLLHAMNDTETLIDMRDFKSEAFRKSVKCAYEFIEKNFYHKVCKKGSKRVMCVGHTHIDIAWLWTVRQTFEKAQRSFATVIALMNRYPDYRFSSSQAILYKAVKQENPALYEEIKKRVREGRWEVEGGMWVEADCNLTGGESLIRQFLYGKTFFKNEFGVDSHVLWLPDVFGYSAALPQILKGCGVDRFVTSKISWNDTNAMPYDTFMWRGIDGTEVFSHFLTAQEAGKNWGRHTTYVAMADPCHIKGTYDKYEQKYQNSELMITVGYGDGGGGTMPEHCEYVDRLQYGLPGMPTAEWSTVNENLDCILRDAKAPFPTWVGELYLEYHRGTYTSEVENKYNNRKCEFLMQNVEQGCVLGSLLLGEKPEQEKEQKMHDLWETMLTNQFHDVIPGSSIKEVYQQTDIEYAETFAFGKGEIEKMLSALSGQVCEDGVLVWNTNSVPYTGSVEADGKRYFVKDIPACGYAVVKPEPMKNRVKASRTKLENDYYVLKFDKNADIVSYYDKREGRELLKCGRKIEYLFYEDLNPMYDAWELSRFYREKVYHADEVLSCDIVTEEDRTGLRTLRKFDKSTVLDTVWLYQNDGKVVFEDTLDWHTEHIMVKRMFPLDILTEKATCEIQYGAVERPTHANTSWDAAKYEVCAHKYVDVSETDYGVALINDSRYGHGLQNNDLTLSLLKCATYPNPDCDKGVHHTSYALYAHKGSALSSDVPAKAYVFNNPPYAKEAKGGGKLPAAWSLVHTDCPHVLITTVKPAEPDYGTRKKTDDIIVRLYETNKMRGKVTLHFGFTPNRVSIADMLENVKNDLQITDNSVTFDIKPFEIITFRIAR